MGVLGVLGVLGVFGVLGVLGVFGVGGFLVRVLLLLAGRLSLVLLLASSVDAAGSSLVSLWVKWLEEMLASCWAGVVREEEMEAEETEAEETEEGVEEEKEEVLKLNRPVLRNDSDDTFDALR